MELFTGLLGKLGKYAIFTVFTGITTWLAIRFGALMGAFLDWRLTFLIISCLMFIVIMAIKRGVWH